MYDEGENRKILEVRKMKFLFFCMCAYVLGWFAKSVMDDDVNTGIAIMIIAVCLYIYSGYGFIKSEVFSEQPAQETESQETQKDDLKEENHTKEYSESQKETRKIQERKLRKLVDSGKTDIFINGEPASDDFDLDGIRLKDYEIKFKNGKVYLISY